LGLFLICSSLFLFDEQVPHPSFITLPPVIGTMLIIQFSHEREPISNLLASRPLVALGLISYSFYLWHFPVFAFAKMSDHEASAYDKVEWIALSIVLSVSTYFLVEKPARNRALVTKRALLIALFSSIAILTCTFAYLYRTEGAAFRLQDLNGIVATDYWQKNKGNRERFSTHGGCWLGPDEYDPGEPFEACRSSETLQERNLIMVIGDSHVAGVIPGLIDEFGRDAVVQRVMSGCRPFIEYGEPSSEETREFCATGFRAALSEVENLQPNLLIFGGSYRVHEMELLVGQFSDELEGFESRSLMMGPLPRGSIIKMLSRQQAQDPLNFEVPERWTPMAITFELDDAFKAASESLGIKYLSPVSTFCEEERCLVRVGHDRDAVVAWDHAHLTHKASRFLVSENLDLISEFLDQ